MKANSIQTVKMAEALSRLVPDFRLVTQLHWARFLRPRFDFESWYGVRDPFSIVRLGSWRAKRHRVNRHSDSKHFAGPAAAYAHRVGADLVYTRLPEAARHTVNLGLPTICEEHEPPTDHGFRHIAASVNSQTFIALVTVTDRLAEQFEAVGVPAEKLFVFPDAVDLPAFQGLPDRQTARQQLRLPTDRFLAVYSGHLYEKKGVLTIIEAARLLPEIEFVFVGGLLKDVNRCREVAGGASNVRFVGFVPYQAVPDYLAAADVLLLANSARYVQSETTSPLKLFEYMASGRPIIASDLPVLRRHLSRENCRLFEPDSAESLALQLRNVQAEPSLNWRLSEQAAKDVLPFTWDLRAQAILDFYRGRQAARSVNVSTGP